MPSHVECVLHAHLVILLGAHLARPRKSAATLRDAGYPAGEMPVTGTMGEITPPA